METSLKTDFAQIFFRCPKSMSCPKFGGDCSPPRPPGPYAYGLWPQKVAFRSQNYSARAKLMMISDQARDLGPFQTSCYCRAELN